MIVVTWSLQHREPQAAEIAKILPKSHRLWFMLSEVAAPCKAGAISARLVGEIRLSCLQAVSDQFRA